MDKKLDHNNFLSLDLNSAPLIHTSGDSPNAEFEADLVHHESKPSLKSDLSANLVDELNRMKSENKKLSEMLFLVCENYSVLQNHMMDLMNSSCCTGSEEDDSFLLRKRKRAAEINSGDASSENIYADESPRTHKEIRTNISRVFVRTQPTDTSLLVKDGYHWRKYGQKVTKDNPSPRAYFKCSFAPNCQVKKKVQRSIGDPSILVATYEGEHNHPNPLQAEMLAATSPAGGSTSYCKLMNSINEFPSSSSIVIPACRGVFNRNIMEKNYLPIMETDDTVQQKLMVEQMASSLSRNPSFTAALVAAISGRLLSHDHQHDGAEKQ